VGFFAREQFCHVEEISLQYSHKTQQHISIVLIHDHHGGRRCTTAAIVPYSRFRGVETLANRLCNNAMQLKLEHLMNVYYLLAYFLPRRRQRPRKTTHKAQQNELPDALLNHGSRHRPMAALVTPSLHRGIQQPTKTCGRRFRPWRAW